MEVKPIIGDTWMGDLQDSLFSLSFKHVKELKGRIDEHITSLDQKADLKRMTQEELHHKAAGFQNHMNDMSSGQRDSVSVFMCN